MGFEINWFSQAGSKTPSNRDYAGVGVRMRTILCAVSDGSTTTPRSDELVREFTRSLVDRYVTSADEVKAETLTAWLRAIHGPLTREFPLASAGYAIAQLDASGRALLLHAGDCLFGAWAGSDPVQWLSQPHTLANALGSMPIAAIAGNPARHRLTRSFRPREFIAPDTVEVEIADRSLVIATDGFWAELAPAEQAEFLLGRDQRKGSERDDRSLLLIRHHDNGKGHQVRPLGDAADNLYLRRSECMDR